jgi:acetyl-CoA acetyltransferase
MAPDIKNYIDDVVLGCVTPVGDQGMDIAKTAALAAGWNDTTAGVQLNRFCASGLEAVNMGAMKMRSGFEDLVVVGGVESHEPSAPWALTAAPGRWIRRPTSKPALCRRVSVPT